MVCIAYETIWLRSLLKEHDFLVENAMKMDFDSQDPNFHERTKHVEVDCHFIKSKSCKA